MANVTATTGWAFTADAHPSGTLTIDSGSNRKLVVFVGRENNTDPAPTITVGGVSPTESFDYYYNPVSTTDHWLYAFVWNEAAIESMSGASVSYSTAVATFARFWGYGTVEDTDQANLTDFTGTASSETGAPSVATTSSAGDLITVLGIAATITGTFSGWDTLTEIFDADIDSARGGFAAGNGGDATTAVTRSVSEPTSVVSVVFPDYTAVALDPQMGRRIYILP